MRLQVVDAGGIERLEHLVIRHSSGSAAVAPANALFIFIGVPPHSGWLGDAIALDDNGYVLTGQDLIEQQPAAWPLRERPPAWLETQPPGGFRGRRHSTWLDERVAAAVGEGSTAALLAGCRQRGDRPERADPEPPRARTVQTDEPRDHRPSRSNT